MNLKSYSVCLALLLLMVLLMSAPVSADQRPVTELDTVTVIATPIIEGNEVDRYGTQKTTVTELQMRDLNAQDLASALRRTPGVSISRYNMVGSFGGAEGGGVFIRGMGASRPGADIKTFVDGVPMYMSIWNHPLLDLMSIDGAEAIEVYKSPQPHQFGNAFGAINIVPRRITTPGFDTRAEIAGGSYGTLIGKAAHGGRQGNLDYLLGGGYRTSDGHREQADGRLQNLYGRVGYDIADRWNVALFTLFNDNYANDPGVLGADSGRREGRYETDAWLTTLTLSNRFAATKGHLKVYRNAGQGAWVEKPTAAGAHEFSYYDFTFYGLKARQSLHLWPGGEILLGLDWDVTEGEYDQHFTDGRRDRWEGHDFTILSPYLAVSQEWGRRDGFYIVPSAGVRWYDNSDFDAAWSPHAGLVVGYRDTEVHAGYSRGVIYPGLDVVVFSEKVIPALRSSWRNLNPEIVDHVEVGLRQRFGRLAVAEITWFYDDGRDRYVVVPPPPPPPVYENIDSYRIQGLETSLSLFPTDDLAFFAGVTWLDTQPATLPYAPELTISGGLNWRFLSAFRLSLDCQYVDHIHTGPRARRQNATNTDTVDSYFVINGKLSYNFALGADRLQGEVFVAGENLTNADYEYRPGYPMPGTTGMLGVGVRF